MSRGHLELDGQGVADLLRASPHVHSLLHEAAQHWVDLDPPSPWPATSIGGQQLRGGRPVAVARPGVAGQLPAHRRGAAPHLLGDRPAAQSSPVQVADRDPVVRGQVSGADGRGGRSAHRRIVKSPLPAAGSSTVRRCTAPPPRLLVREPKREPVRPTLGLPLTAPSPDDTTRGRPSGPERRRRRPRPPHRRRPRGARTARRRRPPPAPRRGPPSLLQPPPQRRPPATHPLPGGWPRCARPSEKQHRSPCGLGALRNRRKRRAALRAWAATRAGDGSRTADGGRRRKVRRICIQRAAAASELATDRWEPRWSRCQEGTCTKSRPSPN